MSLVQKMIAAAKLDVSLYESVEADQTATTQAMTVVLISAVAAGIGAIRSGIWAFFFGLVAALVGWVIWAFLCYIIGTKLLPEAQTKADLGELLRTVGFAQSPGVLRIFGIIPILGVLINLIVFVWVVIAMVVAVRQALDYQSTGRAIGVVLIGALVYLFISLAVGLVVGTGAAMVGGLS